MWKTYFLKNSEKMSVEYSKVIVKKRTAIQEVGIIKSKTMGEIILIDDSPQSVAVDEFIYHETLVHPAVITFGKPKKVFIAGGGEGCLIRELLKYKFIESIVQCDIDKEAIEIFDKYLYHWHKGSYHDKRVKMIYKDARTCLENSKDIFDIIIVDITAPISGGPSWRLFTKEFYEVVFNRLSTRGVLTFQAQSANINNLECFCTLINTLNKVFPVVRPMHAVEISMGGDWGYILCSKGNDPKNITKEEIKKCIEDNKLELSFYDEEIHSLIFQFPKYFYNFIKKHKEISTDKNPFKYPRL